MTYHEMLKLPSIVISQHEHGGQTPVRLLQLIG